MPRRAMLGSLKRFIRELLFKSINLNFTAGTYCPSWPGVLLNGNLLARFQRAFV